jgi:hypothetical protein
VESLISLPPPPPAHVLTGTLPSHSHHQPWHPVSVSCRLVSNWRFLTWELGYYNACASTSPVGAGMGSTRWHVILYLDKLFLLKEKNLLIIENSLFWTYLKK